MSYQSALIKTLYFAGTSCSQVSPDGVFRSALQEERKEEPILKWDEDCTEIT